MKKYFYSATVNGTEVSGITNSNIMNVEVSFNDLIKHLKHQFNTDKVHIKVFNNVT